MVEIVDGDDMELCKKSLKEAHKIFTKAQHEHEWYNLWDQLNMVFQLNADTNAEREPKDIEDRLRTFVHADALSYMYQCLDIELNRTNRNVKELWEERTAKFGIGSVTQIIQEKIEQDPELCIRIFAYMELSALVMVAFRRLADDPMAALEFVTQDAVVTAYGVPNFESKAFLLRFTLDLDRSIGQMQVGVVNLLNKGKSNGGVDLAPGTNLHLQ